MESPNCEVKDYIAHTLLSFCENLGKLTFSVLFFHLWIVGVYTFLCPFWLPKCGDFSSSSSPLDVQRYAGPGYCKDACSWGKLMRSQIIGKEQISSNSEAARHRVTQGSRPGGAPQLVAPQGDFSITKT